MEWIIAGILVTIIGFVGIGALNLALKKKYISEMLYKADSKEEREEIKKIKVRAATPLQFIALIGLLLFIPAFVCYVPANNVGIVYNAVGGTSEQTLSEGIHIKSPLEKVYLFSTEVQTTNVTMLTTQTKDSQYVNTALDIKYQVNPANAYIVFKQFGSLERVDAQLIIPTSQRVLELITVQYNIMDILGESRTSIYMELEAAMTEELSKYGIDFYAISISDMDAGEELEEAITREAVAKKNVETAAQELERARTEALQLSVQAQAEQDAAIIEAETRVIEAQAQKEANDLLNQSLTETVLQQQWIDKWDGHVPTYYGGDGADLIFNTAQSNSVDSAQE